MAPTWDHEWPSQWISDVSSSKYSDLGTMAFPFDFSQMRTPWANNYIQEFLDDLFNPAYFRFSNNQVPLLQPITPPAPHLPLNASQFPTRWVGRGQWRSGWVVLTFPGKKPYTFLASFPSFIVTGNNSSEQLLSALKF